MYKSHAGETCLLVGNGANLHLTPPAWFQYPSFGMNTIHKYDGWKPTYYTAVDNRVMREFGNEIAEKYRNIKKFIPYPDLDDWQGENFHRFYHRAGVICQPIKDDMLERGIVYGNIMQVSMQIAAWMGFTTLLMIGVQHKPDEAQSHFWGWDGGMHNPPVKQWFGEYVKLVAWLKDNHVEVLNISADTYVPENIIPRDDYKKWLTNWN